MNKLFNISPDPRVPRSAMDLSHEVKLSAKMGLLYPILCKEVVPGDKFSIDTQSMIRFAPMLAPIMHRINAHVHFFYVPERILWPDGGWEKFITGDSPNINLPMVPIKDVVPGSLADHMGLPLMNLAAPMEFRAGPFQAVTKIWNEFYRDQNLEAELDISDMNLMRVVAEGTCPRRSIEKDYFTSALPWAQKGTAPLINAKFEYQDVSVVGIGNNPPISHFQPDGQLIADPTQNGGVNFAGLVDQANNAPVQLHNLDSIGIEVEELRRTTRLQMFLERIARTGSRYAEHLLGIWKVKSSDQRLDRPEYIGGGKSPVVISEVLNTTAEDNVNSIAPLGEMAGHGINVGRTNNAYKYVEEHGFIIGLLSVLPEPAYMQGVHRMWTRNTQLDFYFPDFANLGEQAIKNKELYFQGTSDDEETFGYQSIWAEYKYAQSTVHGDFRTNLEFWHLARKFGNLPTLNDDFIHYDDDELKRIFANIGDEDYLWCQLYNKITAVRPMPFIVEPRLG